MHVDHSSTCCSKENSKVLGWQNVVDGVRQHPQPERTTRRGTSVLSRADIYTQSCSVQLLCCEPAFSPRDAMLARHMLSSRVCPFVRHKPILYQNEWTNRAGFWHRGFLPAIPHCIVKKYGVSPKIRVLPSGTLSQTRTQKISPRQVDRVVNNTRRRRRRSSLLKTPIRQSTSRGC